ncbi:FAD-dependent thymidylate synthase [Patescibacteria group bacterium]|nr:FAD-dependent thymidylate synthase [Patescibacteria group bacterium]
MPNFTPEEKKLLEKYVTSVDDNVFAVRNMPGLVGAIYARYSRAPGGFRDTLLKEFISEGNIDAARAQDLIERVLIAFGDDSVGELEGAHVSFEEISMIATKEIEDRRIGGSPIEQSTRYVFYDQRDNNGHWMYVRPPEIMNSEHASTYIETMDFIFSTYADLVEPMQQYYRKLKPVELAEYDINGDGHKEHLTELTDNNDIKAFQRTYKMDIRTKACDTLRYLLPLSTKTNVGIFGNGRFFQGLISHCYTSDIPEVQRLGEQAHRALDQIMPRYVKRAKCNDYQITIRNQMHVLADRLLAGVEPETKGYVTLVDSGEQYLALRLMQGESVQDIMQDEADGLTLAHMLYPYTRLSLAQLRTIIRDMAPKQRQEISQAYIGDRQTRRDRPGRAFEAGYPHIFDLLTDFGTYKDLMRHRMTTQLRQKFSPLLGFSLPEDLIAAGYADRAHRCHERAVALYERLLPNFPAEASYATLHGNKVRWLMGLNDREAFHLIELRTIPQGHASYRRVGQEMHRALSQRSPWLAEAIKFVDYNDYQWARADSEAQQRVKERALEKNNA